MLWKNTTWKEWGLHAVVISLAILSSWFTVTGFLAGDPWGAFGFLMLVTAVISEVVLIGPVWSNTPEQQMVLRKIPAPENDQIGKAA